jgi:hypothetical protein
MSIKRLSGAGLTTPKSNKVWDQITFQSGMFALATVRLSSNQTSVVFSGIPSDYSHLQLRMIVRTDLSSSFGDWILVNFNSDTNTSNYRWHLLYGDTAIAAGTSGQGLLLTARAGGGSSTAFGAGIVDILDYASTSKNKTIKTLSGVDNNTGTSVQGIIALSSGLWINSNTAINSITITSQNSANLLANSHFALYGIKAV